MSPFQAVHGSTSLNQALASPLLQLRPRLMESAMAEVAKVASRPKRVDVRIVWALARGSGSCLVFVS